MGRCDKGGLWTLSSDRHIFSCIYWASTGCPALGGPLGHFTRFSKSLTYLHLSWMFRGRTGFQGSGIMVPTEAWWYKHLFKVLSEYMGVCGVKNLKQLPYHPLLKKLVLKILVLKIKSPSTYLSCVNDTANSYFYIFGNMCINTWIFGNIRNLGITLHFLSFILLISIFRFCVDRHRQAVWVIRLKSTSDHNSLFPPSWKPSLRGRTQLLFYPILSMKINIPFYLELNSLKNFLFCALILILSN